MLANGMDQKFSPSAKKDKKEKREAAQATKTEERARRVNNVHNWAGMAGGLAILLYLHCVCHRIPSLARKRGALMLWTLELPHG